MHVIDKVNHEGYTITLVADWDCESPRADGDYQISRFALTHNRYSLPNEDAIPFDDFGGWDEAEQYIRDTYKPVVLLPVVGYDHGALRISVGTSYDSWDGGRLGFVYVTQERLNEVGCPLDKAEGVARREVERFDAWSNGDCFGYIIKDKHGSEVDSCWGYIGDDREYVIKECKATVDREREASTSETEHLSSSFKAASYLRSLVSADPKFNAAVEVINIDSFTTTIEDKQTLILDLTDGTSIRLDIQRYKRD